MRNQQDIAVCDFEDGSDPFRYVVRLSPPVTSAMIRISISSYTPTCKHLLLIAIKSIAQEQTSHWTDLDFLSYDIHQT